MDLAALHTWSSPAEGSDWFVCLLHLPLQSLLSLNLEGDFFLRQGP